MGVGASIRERSEWDAARRGTPSSPDRSRLLPLTLDYTRLARSKIDRVWFIIATENLLKFVSSDVTPSYNVTFCNVKARQGLACEQAPSEGGKKNSAIESVNPRAKRVGRGSAWHSTRPLSAPPAHPRLHSASSL